MFNSHEALKCAACKKAFMGRKPAGGTDAFCSECQAAETLPIVNDGDKIPDTVHEEIVSGGGSIEDGFKN